MPNPSCPGGPGGPAGPCAPSGPGIGVITVSVDATGVCAGAGVEEGTAVALAVGAGALGEAGTDGATDKATTTIPVAASELPAIM